jgi:hypothetical protein
VFIQTNGGTNYFLPAQPYIRNAVHNAPDSSDIIALSSATTKTLIFSKPVDNLFFAVVSLNGNGYAFDKDFTVESYGQGFWGNGTLARNVVNGKFELDGSGEAHGVIRFTGPVSSITWSSQTNEYWNGFTVGTYGVAAAVPEPESYALMLAGLVLIAGITQRRSSR